MQVDNAIAANRHRRRVAAIAIGSVVGLTSSAPMAAITLFSASLTGAQEIPANLSLGVGVGTVVLNDLAGTITVNESWNNLEAAANASHIHNAVAGINGPIVLPLTGVPSATAGSIPSQTYAISPAQIAQLLGGTLYMNVHSGNFPNGEIRGQLGPAGGPACAVTPNIIVDGGFEANTDAGTNPNWASTSTTFGSVLCTVAACTTGAPPKTGNGWVWFDNTGSGIAAEVGTASQTVTLPVGATASLTYFQQFGAVTAPASSVMTVTVDGTVVQTINEPAVADAAYIQRTLDLSAFANGTPRLLSFNYSRPAGTTFSDNATVDDVALAITACPGATPPPVLQGAKSRKVHGGAGTFDLPLP